LAVSLIRLAEIPVSIYIHFPWCEHKCPYCDFNAHALKGALPERDYLDAVRRDLETDLPLLGVRPVQSVFIGGGTPSLLSSRGIRILLEAVENSCRLVPDAEITMEANPGAGKSPWQEYVAAGVNRVSLGVQSFDDASLAALGRTHSGAEARAAVAQVMASGIRSCNVDLIHGLPGQTVSRSMRDLRIAMDLQVPHISWYQLTIEPNTVFFSHRPRLPDEELLASIEEQGLRLLSHRGYQRYEVSAFALRGQECRHNLNYWRFGDYLGIGPGAHGKITGIAPVHVLRRWKTRHPRHYQARMNALKPDFVAGAEKLTGDQLALEFLLNALRLVEGVPIELFSARTGLPAGYLDSWRRQQCELGLLAPGTDLRTTPTGLAYLDDLLVAFWRMQTPDQASSPATR